MTIAALFSLSSRAPRPRKVTGLTRLLTAAIAVLLLALAWLGDSATGEAAEGETTILGDLLSRALSTPTSRVSIGAVDGALSSDATIRDVAIADRNGVWLRLDQARLIWRRTALLSRRLEIDRLEIGRLEVGTETLIDKSKSVKTPISRLFNEQGAYDFEGLDRGAGYAELFFSVKAKY